MTEYTLLVSWPALQFMEGLSPRLRKKLRDRFVSICQDPSAFSDYRETDNETGRRLDVSICGGIAIIYWEDFTDRHLKILKLRPADR